jgi:hypothetical protein
MKTQYKKNYKSQFPNNLMLKDEISEKSILKNVKKEDSSQPATWVSYRTHNLSQSVLNYEIWISLYKANQNKSQNTMPNRLNIEG